MIFVDTSVWIAYLRSADRAVVGTLIELLDGDSVALAAPVRLELLTGASHAAQPRLARLLDALMTFYPSRATFALAEQWIAKARRAGQLFGAMDLLIGALAAEQGAAVWSLDGDFDRMARQGFVTAFRP